MTRPNARPTLTLYRRAACDLCDHARQMLQVALEERATRGDPIPSVAEVDIETDPALEARYGSRIPVMLLGGVELELATGGRRIRAFLDRALGRLA